jgi:hypothetical protein
MDNDGEEAALLAQSLDSNGAKPPLDGISWLQAWKEGLLTATQVFEAAAEELSLS